MDIRNAKYFYIGDWLVAPHEDTVNMHGRSERLEPLAMQVLFHLAARAGEVVARTELERDVWKGGVVGYDSVTNTVIKLRKDHGDNARSPRYRHSSIGIMMSRYTGLNSSSNTSNSLSTRAATCAGPSKSHEAL